MASQVPKQGALSIFFSFLIYFGTCLATLNYACTCVHILWARTRARAMQ